MERVKTVPAVMTLVLLAAGAGFCQNPATASESGFEVASIKPADPAASGMRIGISPGGTFTATNATLKALIQQAYEVRDFQISGGPGWLDTQRYDIAAKSNLTGTSDDEMRKMTDQQRDALKAQFLLKLQLLLADRFHLKIHRETKELPVYALSVARIGPKIKTAADDDATHTRLRLRSGGAGKLEISGTRIPLANLVRALSDQVGRTVVDKTGLTGNYDFTLTFTPDLGLPPATGDAIDRPTATGGDGPSIFTALQEQLGLRLESQKGPVEVLVIDSAQKASEN
jgi:bla regulator protein blaR1